ncbi:MAG: acetyl/propionyl/methylcrotonyl-CoA carboxylase subunit alpha [Ignavibacteriaceae bacterium]
MFKKVLIFNRGEIAVRIAKTVNELGITSAVLYSDADKSALHTRYADESYSIGGNYPAESYLDVDKVLSIAKRIKADAIHPGYGFLSENAEFIKAVEDSGIVFIGPSSKTVEVMGKKTDARRLMHSKGVPIVPGTIDPIKSLEEARKLVQGIGFPVLIKASAGGGGKGMKKVTKMEEFDDAFESAKREALKAFKDDSVFIEKLIEDPRHIEVQILGDQHGNYVHLFERECSMQRRHQKVVEEAPSAYLDEATRAKITEYALLAAKACGYYNAGTVECLVDKEKNIYFLEMNTRLQVEHPVTELITGTDLVREQIFIAMGRKLELKQENIKAKGHAVECRIYAEDPDNNFLPTTGKVMLHRLPSGPGLRVDRGIDFGTEVGIYYDPLLTKICTWGVDRTSAIDRMSIALSNYLIAGLYTNISFLKWIINNEKFRKGEYHINFIENEFLSLAPNEWKKHGTEEAQLFATAFAAISRNNKRTQTAVLPNNRSCHNKWGGNND